MTAEDVKSILWLVPAIPLIASFLNGFISLTFLASKKKSDLNSGQMLARNLTGIIGITAIVSSLTISIILLLFLQGYSEHRVEVEQIYTWIPSGDFQIKFGLSVDPLTSMMLVVVNTISLLVHIFSTGYMKNEDGFARFYCYLPFFTFSMIMLVMVNNFLLLYVFWEAVGLSSYLLIGFWFGKKYDWGRLLPAEANKKAFVVNRVGDFGFGLGIMWLFITMLSQSESTATSLFDRLNYQNVFKVFEEGKVDGTTVFLISILLFMGAMGKSAQIPLHVWLPDAMAGPTPVSALIHAATMVTAGVYLVGRINPIIVRSEEAIYVVAVIGIATAFFGSTVGTTQKDIKAVMAYSTVSQLGYMFFALGAFGWVAAFFHLMTHAFFKGLLFLGCGAIIHSNEETIKEKFDVIHHNAEEWAKKRYPDDPEKAAEYAFELFEAAENAIEYGVDPKSSDRLLRDGLDPQDMDYMGNYFKQMPVVAISMCFAAAALAGVPLTAGFWSKDEILGQTFNQGGGYYIIYGLGLFAALLTAFYSFRMIFSVFWSKSYRLPAALNKLAWVGMQKKAAELGIENFNGREIVEFVEESPDRNRNQDAVHIHKQSWSMKAPLIFLAFMSIAAGYVGLPNILFGKGADVNLFEKFLDPTFESALKVVPPHEGEFGTTVFLLVLSGLVALTGVGIAYYMYHLKRDTLPEAVRERVGPLYAFSRNKWYVDEAYNLVFVSGGLAFFKLVWRFIDIGIIDGVVNGLGWLTRTIAQGLRKVQTGFIANYALYIAVGLVGVVAIFYLTVGIKF